MSDEGFCCLVILTIIISVIGGFIAGFKCASVDDIFYEKRTQCEMALNQERCVDTLIYVTKPYTKNTK